MNHKQPKKKDINTNVNKQSRNQGEERKQENRKRSKSKPSSRNRKPSKETAAISTESSAGNTQSNTQVKHQPQVKAEPRIQSQLQPRIQSQPKVQDESQEYSQGKVQSQTKTYRHVRIKRERPSLSRNLGREASLSADSLPSSAQEGSVRTISAASGRSRSYGGRRTPAVLSETFAPSSRYQKGAQLKVIPLGGLDAIGKNMTVFECGDDMIVDDAGLMFPDDSHPGIDLILPDYTYILENAHKLRGIIITHGHEDHTGALPYLLKDLDREVCIYATKITLGLIEIKLDEHRVKNVKLVEIKPGQRISLGCFNAEFFAVNHSIPGAVGVFFESPAGNVLHTGDFKLDQTPIDGVTTDFGALAKFGAQGVDLMMSDSTNATKDEFTPSEAEVGKALLPIVAQAKGKVVVASFASHIHRMQQICDVAVACGRKVAVTGRSMIQNTDIARKLDYLNISDNDIIDAYELNHVPPHELVVLCTGSQGEPMSALARIANGEHKTISLDAGDTVIISATPVPGNEKAVTKVINALAKLGADVYDKHRALVHVSGHAGPQELKIVLSIVNPRYFLPVHGEATHLRAHAKLATEVGVRESNIFICENGETLLMEEGRVRLGEPVQSGIVFVDGFSVGDTSQKVLDERSDLSVAGVVLASAAISLRKRSVYGLLQIELLGIAGSEEAYLREAAQFEATKVLSESLREGKGKNELYKDVRDALRKVIRETTKTRPYVVVQLVEV